MALALVARQLTTRTPILGTPFDRPLFLFLWLQQLGAWLAYSQQAGWNRFWLIIAGVTVYIGIVYLPDEIDLRGSRRYFTVAYVIDHGAGGDLAVLSALYRLDAMGGKAVVAQPDCGHGSSC